MVGVNSWEKKSVENLKPNGKHQYRRKRPEKIFKSCVDEKFLILEATLS